MTTKRIPQVLLLFAIILTLCLAGPGMIRQVSASDATAAQSTTVKKKGLVQQGSSYYYYKSDGTKLSKSWKTVNGKRYYFRKSGKAAVGPYKVKGVLYLFNQKGQLKKGSKSRFVTYKNKKYYVDKKGRITTGWFVAKGKLYYATSSGKQSTKTREGIKFSKKGYAKSSTASKLKIKTMEIVDKITSSKMSKSQKLRACWNYVVGSGWSYRGYSTNFSSGWQKACAYSMLTSRSGNCKSFACAFAALAAEVGYDPYVIWGTVPGLNGVGSTTHCWVRINGLSYDPEGQWKGWNKGQYGTSGYNAQLSVSRTFRFKTY